MSERKVLNKYFPPNFDPSAIPRRKVAKDKQYKVRLMAPFTMVCNTCGEIIHAHKKFNARKETVEGESYYSIRIFRFYIRCPRCSAEITFKTDPKNTDYVCEHGATRNFEPLKDERLEGEEEKRLKEAEEENNPMKALENRTLDSKREMDILDALDEIRTRNARNERVDSDIVLEKLSKEDQDTVRVQLMAEEDEDDMLARAIFKTMEGESVRRIANGDEDEPDPLQLLERSGLSLSDIPKLPGSTISKRKRAGAETNLGIVLKKKKENGKSSTIDVKAITTKPTASALGALGDYSDSDEDV